MNSPLDQKQIAWFSIFLALRLTNPCADPLTAAAARPAENDSASLLAENPLCGAHPSVMAVSLALLDDIPACAATLFTGDSDVDHCRT
jgi:hypothetical protein